MLKPKAYFLVLKSVSSKGLYRYCHKVSDQGFPSTQLKIIAEANHTKLIGLDGLLLSSKNFLYLPPSTLHTYTFLLLLHRVVMESVWIQTI